MEQERKKHKYKHYLFEEKNSKIPGRTRRRWMKELKDSRAKADTFTVNNFMQQNETLKSVGVDECSCNGTASDKLIENGNVLNSPEFIANKTDTTLEEKIDHVDVSNTNDSELLSDKSDTTYTNSSLDNLDACDEDKINHHEPASLDEILFPQSGINKKSILTIVQGLTLKHKMTHEARKDILELIRLLGNLDEETFSTSNYTMAKYFDHSDASLDYIFYCDHCKTVLEGPIKKKEIESKYVTCSNVKCALKQKIEKNNNNMFIAVDLKTQIKSILQDDSVQSSMVKFKNTDENISDVQDGSIYKNLKKTTAFDLTLNFNTDGAPVFSSSKLSMWPIQCVINELSPKIRFKRLIFAGIWVGKGEPNVHLMNSFMNIFALKMKDLYENGIIINTRAGIKHYKILTLLCCCDSVARPCLQNRVQFNGYFGCSWCYQRGETFGKQVKYPLRENESKILRSKESHMRDLQEVAKTNFQEKIRGVKGPSCLIMNLPHFDPVWGFPIDYMHGVILGVVRQMWDIWTTYTPENRHTFYIGKPVSLKIINKRLTSIKPPHEIQRLPRSIHEKAKWKASEWRNWLLFYALPCLSDVLPLRYLKHFALLIKGVYNLLQENISALDLEESESFLRKFIEKFENYYGSNAMTFNMHSLLHLTESVRRSGPLWASSAFPFESGIYRIKQQVKGPVGVAKQIAKKMYDTNTFINNLNNDSLLDYKTKIFCKNLWSPIKLLYTQEHSSVSFLGAGSLIPEDELISYLSTCNLHPKMDNYYAISYKRCIYNKILLHSAEYGKFNRTNDTIVQTKSHTFLEIQKFFTYNNQCYMITKKLNAEKLKVGKVKFNHIFTQIPQEISHYVVLPITDVVQKCIVIEGHSNVKYFCTFPNLIELSL